MRIIEKLFCHLWIVSFEASPDLDVKLLNGHHVGKISHLGEVLILNNKFFIILSGSRIFHPPFFFIFSILSQYSVFIFILNFFHIIQFLPFSQFPPTCSHSSILSLCFQISPIQSHLLLPNIPSFHISPKILPKIY